MLLFKTSSRLKTHLCTIIQAECEVLLFGLEILHSMEVNHIKAFGDSLMVV
jgi:ribonuclease HI